MKNTFILLIAVASVILLAVACKGRQPQPETVEPNILDSVYTIPTGSDCSLYCIRDCPQMMSADLFRGFNDALLDSILPDGQAEASINVFLLCQNGRYILFDAGLGEAKGGRLMVALDSLQLAPDQITDICITHLHFDHVGGLFNPDGTAAFPSATLHIPQVEFDAWASGKMGDSEITLQIGQAYEGRINLFAQGDTLLGTIASIAAPGHTPGHTIYDLGDVFIVGDIFHAVALQVEHPEFCARFDADPIQAVATRRAILDRARTEDITLCCMHYPYPVCWTMLQDDYWK
jgi:glyoxylase-like metal-dependent hydrolase (beta-lactamase superfamily II)